MFTMFGSFTNQAYNLIRRTIYDAHVSKDPAAVKKLAWTLVAVMVINPLAVIGVDRLKDKLLGREPEDPWWDYVDSIAGYLFFVRDIAKSFTSMMQKGTLFGYDVDVSVLRPINDLIRGMVTLIEAMGEQNPIQRKKKALRGVDLIIASTMTFVGIPYYTPRNIAKGIYKAIEE
jgi:hypothetical protein